VQVYRVGGSVRDELLGRSSGDRDWVVVGATPEMMIASGYRPVGRDFPVFLHPETREEHALARTERKHGRGYRGFEFFASPEVTLEQDLARRDLTISAMARAEDGTLIDPFSGEADSARAPSMSRRRSPRIRCACCASPVLRRASTSSSRRRRSVAAHPHRVGRARDAPRERVWQSSRPG
jgi:hypothetical protein